MMSNVRYQLTKDVYMPLDGQWTIVLSGTVFDAPDTVGVHSSTAATLSPGETPGVPVNGKPTSVRNARRR